MRKYFIFFALFFSFSIFSLAQAAEIVQIQPAKVRLVISPGSAQTGSLTVFNNDKQPKKVRAYLEDWKYLPVCDGTKDFQPAGTLSESAAGWISFVPAEFVVPAFGKQVVNYSVKVPSDAKSAHFAVIFFESYLGESEAPPEGGVNVNVAVRVGSLFYIEPKGLVSRQAKIDGLKIERAQDRYNVSLNFTNTGNVDSPAKASFFIIDRKGVAFARGESGEIYTLPGDSAPFSLYWKEQIPKGIYDLVLTFDIGKALRDANLGDVPPITKEARIEIGDNGEVIRVGELK